MQISMIAAAAANGVIGNNNELPWYLPEDLKYFKSKTIGKPVIMGRKTYESIGRPLPNRVNIVVSRNKRLKINGVEIATSIENAVELAGKACQKLDVDEVMVIGGEKLYRTMLHRADRIYLTEVDLTIDGDAYFPALDKIIWREVSSEQPEQFSSTLKCCFKIYEKVVQNN